MGLRENIMRVFEQVDNDPINHLSVDAVHTTISRSQTVAEKIGAELGPDSNYPLLSALKHCAPVLVGDVLLLKALETARRTQYVDGLPQRYAHDLVDRWARLQAARALFVELCEQVSAPGQSAFLSARFEALTRELKRSVVGLVEALGEGGNFVSWAPVADWAIKCLESVKIGSFDGSIAQALRADV
jgi:hypothetical protein